MSKREKDNKNELISEIINLYLEDSIKESQLYLKLLDNQIKTYQSEINYLENTKPFFFQKRKLKEHNKKIESYEKKIKDTYLKMSAETNEILKNERIINL